MDTNELDRLLDSEQERLGVTDDDINDYIEKTMEIAKINADAADEPQESEEPTPDTDNPDEADPSEASEEYDYKDDTEEEEDEEPEPVRIKKSAKRKKKSKGGKLIFALFMVTFVISVALLSAVGIISVAREILGLTRENVELSIEIPENSGTASIANILEQEGVIGDTTLFRIYSKVKGADGTFIAGIHKINPNMSYSDIIEVLQTEAINPREFVDITFPEGITLIEAAQKLEEAGVCGADDFIRTFNSTKFGFDFEEHVKVSAQKFYKMEGFFFPDTYQFYLEEDPVNVAKKVCKNFEYKITPDMYGRMEDLDMTLEEVITLASIVQAEASGTYDMKMVASVFYNRLNNPDMFPLLQSDPTSNYSEEVIAPNLEVYSQSICDAYDTYKGAGLPPGAICNPGIKAIEAVLYPRESDYFYFCSDLSTGEFFFAETLEEHEENLVKAHLVD